MSRAVSPGTYASRLPDIAWSAVTGGGVSSVAVPPGFSGAEGAWTELIASTTGETHWLQLRITFTTTASQTHDDFVDIGIGPAASEVVAFTFPTSIIDGVVFPLFIPNGSRVSARYSTQNATQPSATGFIARTLGRRPGDTRSSPPKLVTIGEVANNQGTNVNVSNTWVELTAATTQPFQGLIWAGSSNDSSMSATVNTFELGVGASGAEVAVGSVLSVISVSEYMLTDGIVPFMTHIATGSRISVRDSNGATNIKRHCALGIPYT